MKGSQSEEGDLEWHAKGAKIDCTVLRQRKIRIILSWESSKANGVESKNIIKKKIMLEMLENWMVNQF